MALFTKSCIPEFKGKDLPNREVMLVRDSQTTPTPLHQED